MPRNLPQLIAIKQSKVDRKIKKNPIQRQDCDPSISFGCEWMRTLNVFHHPRPIQYSSYHLATPFKQFPQIHTRFLNFFYVFCVVSSKFSFLLWRNMQECQEKFKIYLGRIAWCLRVYMRTVSHAILWTYPAGPDSDASSTSRTLLALRWRLKIIRDNFEL